MMKTSLAASLAAMLLVGQALAADTTRSGALTIESEAQFVRDHADQIERIGDGVYLFVAGPMAGKTLSIGEAGLAYDMAALRAKMAASGAPSKAEQERMQSLEAAAEAFARNRQLAQQAENKSLQSRVLTCLAFNARNEVWVVQGTATVSATAEFMQPIGLGYYAYAHSSAQASLGFPPFGYQMPGPIIVEASAGNALTGETSHEIDIGPPFTASTYAFVFSGPSFNHHLGSMGRVYGTTACWGYLSLDAQFSY